MSEHDFSLNEFNERRSRICDAATVVGLDWFIAFHPASIHWLMDSGARSYQEFQRLLISTKSNDLVGLTRESDSTEFTDDAHVKFAGGRHLSMPSRSSRSLMMLD